MSSHGLTSLQQRYAKFKQKKKNKSELKQSILIFDMMYIFRSQFVMRPEVTENGVRVGAVVGTINHIFYKIKEFNPRLVVCAFDGKDNSKSRQILNENYKSDRGQKHKMLASPLTLNVEDSEKSQEFQRDLLLRFLQLLPFHTIEIDKLEADDIIGYLAKQYSPSGTSKSNKIIFSADKDFIQLIDEKTSWFNSRKKEMVTLKNYREYFDVPIGNVPLLRAILGDSSDGLSGIKGVGEKTLYKLIPEIQTKEFSSIHEFITFIEEEKKATLIESKKGRSLLEGTSKILNTYNIIQLQNPTMDRGTEGKIIGIMKNQVFNDLNRRQILQLLVKYKMENVLEPYKINTIFKYLRPL